MTDLDPKKREALLKRIRALAGMTVENGCTEDEALTAAKMLADLLAKYNLTVDEATLRAEPFSRTRKPTSGEVGARLWKVADGVAFLVGCQYWTDERGGDHINFFGLAHEVEIADYLLKVCARAMRTDEARLNTAWALVNPAKRRQKVLPYLDGMADRLRDRLRRMRPPPPTGKGLVVLKDQLITEEMAKAGIKTQQARASLSRDFESAYGHGVRAADRVALNPGLAHQADETRRLR